MKKFNLKDYDRYSECEKYTIALGTRGLLGSLGRRKYILKATQSSRFLKGLMSVGFERNKK